MQNIYDFFVLKIATLKSNVGFIKHIKNISWVLAEKILRMVVGLFVGIWVVRYLGPEQFGLFSYAISFVGLFTAIATLGLDGIVVRELVENDKKRDILLGTAFWIKLAASFLVLFILAIAVNFTSNDTYTNTLIFIIASAIIFQSFNVIDFYFQSKVLSRYVVFANLITLVISSILKIVFILTEAPLIAFVTVIFFDSLISIIGLIYFYLKNGLSIRSWRFEQSTAVSLMKDSWPLALSAAVGSVLVQIDNVMIGNMLDNESVGQYAAAARLSTIWYFFPVAIASSVLPAIINAQKKDNKLYFSRLQKLYDFMVISALSLAIPMTFFSDEIVNILFGEQYSASSGVLMIHIWAGVFVFLRVASGQWFLTNNFQLLSFYRSLTAAILDIILNYLLIPIYGINGAAIALLISLFWATYGFTILDKRMRPCFIMQTKALFFVSIFKKLGSSKL